MSGRAGAATTCQPGKAHRFHVIGIQPVCGAGDHLHPGQARADAPQQQRIAHAAATGQQPPHPGQVRQQRPGDGGGGQFQQGGLHIGRRQRRAADPCIHPVQVELFAAGTLGRWQREPGIVQQPRQQRLVDPAAGGEGAIGVERGAEVALAPAIEQRIGRTGVETAQAAVAGQQAQVGDTAQVEHRPVLAAAAEHRQVEGRHQRRTVPAGGHVAAAEVGHRGDAGQFGDAVGITDLPGEGGAGGGTMADGLPVRADRPHLRTRDAGPFQQAIGGGGEGDADLGVQLPERVQRRRFGALSQRYQRVAGPDLPVEGMPVHEPAAAFHRELHQCGVDAVGAGAGHQAEEQGQLRIDGCHAGAGNRKGREASGSLPGSSTRPAAVSRACSGLEPSRRWP